MLSKTDVQRLLQPSRLHTERLRQSETPSDAPPLRLLHLVSNTLRVGPRIQAAFEQVGGALRISAATYTAKTGEDLDHFLRNAGLAEAPFILLQVHGMEGEQRLLEPVLRLNPWGRLIVYIHRPEELILRLALENDCSYSAAKGRLGEQLRSASAVVLSGDCCVSEYQDMLPGVLVTSIPLGFVQSGIEVDLASRLKPGAVTFVGSATGWGEMRHLDDLVHLLEAICSAGDSIRVTGYASGRFDHRCDLRPYVASSKTVFLGNTEILGAFHEKQFSNEDGFRNWLNQLAPGKCIIRAQIERGGTIVPESFPEQDQELRRWEERLTDFNVQLYHEVLDQMRDPARRGLPKVEYSGTLHKGSPHEVFVVFESSAMKDVEQDEGLRMIQVPMTAGRPDFDAGAKKIVHLINHPHERERMLRQNQTRASVLGMEEVAFAFYSLIRNLSETPNRL